MSNIEDNESDDGEILYADGLDAAYIGTARVDGVTRAVYSMRECVLTMMASEGMEFNEALEYLEFNTFHAHVGPRTPIYLEDIDPNAFD